MHWTWGVSIVPVNRQTGAMSTGSTLYHMVYRKIESFVNVSDNLSDLFIDLTLLYQINLQHLQTVDLFWYEMKPLVMCFMALLKNSAKEFRGFVL